MGFRKILVVLVGLVKRGLRGRLRKVKMMIRKILLLRN